MNFQQNTIYHFYKNEFQIIKNKFRKSSAKIKDKLTQFSIYRNIFVYVHRMDTMISILSP